MCFPGSIPHGFRPPNQALYGTVWKIAVPCLWPHGAASSGSLFYVVGGLEPMGFAGCGVYFKEHLSFPATSLERDADGLHSPSKNPVFVTLTKISTGLMNFYQAFSGI